MSRIGRGSTYRDIYMEEWEREVRHMYPPVDLYEEVRKEVISNFGKAHRLSLGKTPDDTMSVIVIDSLGPSGVYQFEKYRGGNYIEAIKHVKSINGILYINIPRCSDFKNIAR